MRPRRRSPVLAGSEVFRDVPMLILREATREEYLTQAIPDDWCIPPLHFDCPYIYEVMAEFPFAVQSLEPGGAKTTGAQGKNGS